MELKEKEELVTRKSLEVLKDCCRENGAIVAANTEHSSYPKDVQSYHYVWPRDAAYICIALSSEEIYEPQLKFFSWLMHRAEGIEKGIIYQNYYVNGRKRWTAFQPDQAGIILVALGVLIKKGKADENAVKLSEKIAEGIVSLWKKNHFKYISQDLWEEDYCYPELEQCFTYSAAIVGFGLKDIGPLIGKDYSKIYKEMFDIVASADMKKEKMFLKKTGTNSDGKKDASLLGLIWPAELNKSTEYVETIVNALKQKKGIMRYEFDRYDGFKYEGVDAKRGAGAWPLLSFWAAIAYKICGEDTKAKEAYNLGITSADEKGFLAEQVFSNNIQASIKPLAWASAMQIIAKRILNGEKVL